MERGYKTFINHLKCNEIICGEQFMKHCDLTISKVAKFEEHKFINEFVKCAWVCDDLSSLQPSQVKKIFQNKHVIFVYTDFICDFIQFIVPYIDHMITIFTHNSDYSIDHKKMMIVKKYSNKINTIFTPNINLLEKNNLVQPIPIGIPNKRYIDPLVFLQTIKKLQTKKKQKLLYLNISHSTNPCRVSIIKLLTQKGYQICKPKTWKKYMEDMSSYKFCVSPPGNGIQCHRTWEALYLGVIPIVQKSYVTDHLSQDLPVLVIDDWNDLSVEFLKDIYKQMSSKKYNWEKLKILFYL